MQDLNDLFYFAKVVECGGFMAAGRKLGLPKSRLSRRVAELEARLGVRLLQRTTRKLALTEVGANYYEHCRAMLAEAEAAEEAILRATAEPRGLVRVTCPEQIAKSLLGPILPRFLAANPQVRVWLDATGRRVDLIEEGVDVALRVRPVIEESASLVARRLGVGRLFLVASPTLLAGHGVPKTPAELARYPLLTMSRPDGRGLVALLDSEGHEYSVWVDAPRLMTDDLVVLAQAAVAGLGVAALPVLVCQEALEEGRLVQLLPEYQIPGGILHVVFPSRRHLVPAVRSFIDFLVADLVGVDNPAYDRP
jgi:DNA-binding transcriptional LysR family regulator